MKHKEQTQTLASLYLLYKHQATELQEAGFSPKEAFWLHFGCLPSLPWDEQAQEKIPLTQILRLYVGTYQHDVDDGLDPEGAAEFPQLLIDRYRMARETASDADPLHRQRKLGSFLLPGTISACKAAVAVSILLHTLTEWQKQDGNERLPCALVDDTGD